MGFIICLQVTGPHTSHIPNMANKSMCCFPKQWYTEGFWRLGKDIHECTGRSRAPVARQLLCTGCGLGEGQVALVHAKRSVAPLSTEKHICFGTISFRSSSGPPLAQMPPSFPLLPDVSKIPPTQERKGKKYFDFFVTRKSDLQKCSQRSPNGVPKWLKFDENSIKCRF